MILMDEDIRKLKWFRFFFPTEPSLATLYRWTVNGCRGVVLESIQIGNVRCSSVEAATRFVERLSLRPETGAALRTPTQRQRRSEAAAKELERLGC